MNSSFNWIWSLNIYFTNELWYSLSKWRMISTIGRISSNQSVLTTGWPWQHTLALVYNNLTWHSPQLSVSTAHTLFHFHTNSPIHVYIQTQAFKGSIDLMITLSKSTWPLFHPLTPGSPQTTPWEGQKGWSYRWKATAVKGFLWGGLQSCTHEFLTCKTGFNTETRS